MTVTGGIGNVIAYVRGSTDVAFIGGVKNTMTQTLVAGGNIKKPEDLKGKRIGVSRIGGNSHYFTIQALRRYNMEPNRDFSFLQTGGDPETLAALLSGGIEVANLTPPTDSQAIAQRLSLCGLRPGPQNSLCGDRLRDQAFASRQARAGHWPVSCAPWRKPPESCTRTGSSSTRYWENTCALRIASVLDSAYNAEIKVLEPRLVIKNEALQAILDEVAPTDARAKKVKPQELIDSRYLDEMEKSGFFDQLWAKK